jgi:hypothetical protein
MTRARNTADTQTASGGPVSPNIAGKNAVINGGMDIWQRGTTFTATANLTYLADRWLNTTGSTLTVTRDTDVPTSPYFQYSMKMVGSSDNSVSTRLESANTIPLAGQTVTLSFYAKRTSGTGALDVRFYYPSATDNFTTVTQIGSTSVVSASPSSSWVRYQVSVAIGTNITTGLQVLINNTGASTTFITGVQLELGTTATPFSRAGGTIQGELAACQRYYFRTQTGTGTPYICNTVAGSSTTTYANLIHKVTMRSSPTSVEFSAIKWQAINNSGNITAASISDATPENTLFVCTTTGATAGAMNYVIGQTTAGYMAVSAEL